MSLYHLFNFPFNSCEIHGLRSSYFLKAHIPLTSPNHSISKNVTEQNNKRNSRESSSSRAQRYLSDRRITLVDLHSCSTKAHAVPYRIDALKVTVKSFYIAMLNFLPSSHKRTAAAPVYTSRRSLLAGKWLRSPTAPGWWDFRVSARDRWAWKQYSPSIIIHLLSAGSPNLLAAHR